MQKNLALRSVGFDTSFLLHDGRVIDQAIKLLARDSVPCFLPVTVIYELEQLKIWGRISEEKYHRSIMRHKRVHASVIDFKNRIYSKTFDSMCVDAMQRYHGAKTEDVVNDCRILITNLKNGVNLFLSQDYHFTSEMTQEVIAEVANAACQEYHQMCERNLYSVDAITFVAAYQQGSIDMDVVHVYLMKQKKKKKS